MKCFIANFFTSLSSQKQEKITPVIEDTRTGMGVVP